MYYRLKKQYILRGWELLPFGVVDQKSGNIAFLPGEYYEILRLCTGALNSESVLFTKEQKDRFKMIEKNGFVDKFDLPQEGLETIQEYQKYDCRLIRQVHWSITGNCNYRCKHCYMSAPNGTFGETPLEKCYDTIDQMAECGIFRVSLTGGEAMVHPGFWKIVDRLLEKGIHITQIYSNGFLVNEKTIEAFEKRGIHPEFNMSFDGTQGWHQWLRGVEGADKHIEKAFLLCKEHNFPTGSELCLHRGNIHTLRESINKLASWGCQSLKVSSLMAAGAGAEIEDYCLTKDEVFQAYMDYIPHYYEDGEPLVLMLGELFYSSGDGKYNVTSCKSNQAFNPERYCVCGHARNMMYISVDGRILPCLAMSFSDQVAQRFAKLGDIRMKEALKDSFYFDIINLKLDKYFEKHPECAKCTYKYQCAAGCRGIAVNQDPENEDYLVKDMETCDLYKKGYYDRVRKLMQTLGIEEG